MIELGDGNKPKRKIDIVLGDIAKSVVTGVLLALIVYGAFKLMSSWS